MVAGSILYAFDVLLFDPYMEWNFSRFRKYENSAPGWIWGEVENNFNGKWSQIWYGSWHGGLLSNEYFLAIFGGLWHELVESICSCYFLQQLKCGDGRSSKNV